MSNALLQITGACAILALILVPIVAHAQFIPNISIDRTYGGDRPDEIYALVQTGDSGFAIAGYTGDTTEPGLPDYHGGFEDAWFLKLDNSGNVLWEKCLGGSLEEECNSMVQTRDGGYCLAIRTESTNGDVIGGHGDGSDGWIVKLSPSGSIEWQRIVGGTNWDVVYSLIQTDDDGFIAAGYTRSNDGTVVGHHGGNLQDDDAWITKLDASGTIQWSKCYGGNEADWAQSIKQTSDHGYVFCGYTSSNEGDVSGYLGGLQDAWVVKIDSMGNLEWQRPLGGDSISWGASICITSDGGFLVTGGTFDSTLPHYHTGGDAWIAKLSSSGDLQWQRCLGGSAQDKGWSVTELKNGNYMMAGMTMSNNGDVSGNHATTPNGDAWLVELDRQGNIIWQHCYGGTGHDAAFDVIQLSNGSIAFAGMTGSHDGDTPYNHGLLDMWLLVVSDPASVPTGSNESPSIALYPQPARHTITIRYSDLPLELSPRIEIRNVLGIALQSAMVPAGQTESTFDVSNFVPGCYFATISASGYDRSISFQVLPH